MAERIALKIDGTRGMPVRTGIPFPEGALTDIAEVRVVTASGEEAPSQVSATGQWPDGSVRWALFDFAAGEGVYALEYGPGTSRMEPASPLTVAEEDGGVTVDTGAIRFAVDASGMRPISQVQAGGRVVLKEAELTATLPDGSVRRSSELKPTALEVEEAGPLHAVVRIEAEDALDADHKLQHIVRVHAWAGSPDVLLEYALVNGTPREYAFDAATNVTLKGFGIRIPLEMGGGATAAAGRDGDPVQGRALQLHQVSADACEATADGGRISGGRAPGWMAVGTQDAWVGVHVEHFWQKYPKALTADGEAIHIALWDPESPDPVTLDGGEANLHRIRLTFRDEAIDAGAAGAWAKGAATPPIARADGAWIAAGGALRNFAPEDFERHGEYERAVARMFPNVRAVQEKGKEYGMRHFGDWDYHNRYPDGWGNCEYDLGHSHIIQHLRSGSRASWDYAEEVLFHYREVDLIHASNDPKVLGAPAVHMTDHRQGRPTVSHTWLEGLLEHYYLTGDTRSWEKAVGVGDYIAEIAEETRSGTGAPRSPGWSLIGLSAIYRATLNRRYLEAAKVVVDHTLGDQRDNGAWVYRLPECPCEPKHVGGKPFMQGILLTGLGCYHEITEDSAVADAIVRGARWLTHEAWSIERRAFKYIQCPFSKSYSSGVRMVWGIAYAYKLSGYEDLKTMAREVYDSWMEGFAVSEPFSGRRMAEPLREAPFFLGLMREIGAI